MNSYSSGRRNVVFHGHISATPESVAAEFKGNYSQVFIHNADAAIFVVNPSAGIDPHTIELWHSYNDVQTPRMVLATTLPGTEMDFDDAVLLANRVFDQLVTPFLVLHGIDGSPIGLIELLTLNTYDFSTNPPIADKADQELSILVEEFRDEYLQQMEEMGDGAFAAGILFPAIPIDINSGMGVDIVNKYLQELPSRS